MPCVTTWCVMQVWNLQASRDIFTIFCVLGIHSEPFAKLFDGSISSIHASCVRCSRSAGVVGNSFGNVFWEIRFSCWFTGTGYDFLFAGTALGNTERLSVSGRSWRNESMVFSIRLRNGIAAARLVGVFEVLKARKVFLQVSTACIRDHEEQAFCGASWRCSAFVCIALS